MLGFDTNRNDMTNEANITVDNLIINESITLPQTYNVSITSTMLGYVKTAISGGYALAGSNTWQYTGLSISLTPGVWMVNAIMTVDGNSTVSSVYAGISNSTSTIDNTLYQIGSVIGSYYQYCNVNMQRIFSLKTNGVAALWVYCTYSTPPSVRTGNTALIATRIG